MLPRERETNVAFQEDERRESCKKKKTARNKKKQTKRYTQNLLANKLELTLIKTANKNKKMDL